MPDTDHSSILIYVSGNNGSGKSTLGKGLATRLGLAHLPERSDDSYLRDLFSQPKRWSFEAQTHFLSLKVALVKRSLSTSADVIIDRSPYEDAEVFARYFYQARRLDFRAYQTYRRLYQVLAQDLPEPRLIIYCHCSLRELQRRVQERGRDYEQLYPRNHLAILDRLYRSWLQRACRRYPGKVFMVDTEANDFTGDFGAIERVASDVRYLLASSSIPQLSLFADDTPQQDLFDHAARFCGVLTPLTQGSFQPRATNVRRPRAYIAAPFTNRATAPIVSDQLSPTEKEPPQASFGSWGEKLPSHGRIQDVAYREYLEWIESIVRSAGYDTFLPHRDVNRWGEKRLSAAQGASECTKAVFDSDVLIVLPQMSLGAHYEVGVAVGYGLPVIVLMERDDSASFIMEGLGSKQNVSLVRFSSRSELRQRLTHALTGLAERL